MILIDLWHDLVSPPETQAAAVLALLSDPDAWNHGFPLSNAPTLAFGGYITHTSGVWIDYLGGVDGLSVMAPSNTSINLNTADRRRVLEAVAKLLSKKQQTRQAIAAQEIIAAAREHVEGGFSDTELGLSEFRWDKFKREAGLYIDALSRR